MAKSILGRQTDFRSHGGMKYYEVNEIKANLTNLILITHKTEDVLVTAAEDRGR